MIKHEEERDVQTARAKLEKALGRETYDLVIKTLRLVYKIDEETIVSNPELFEEKISKMLGLPVTELIFKDSRV
jgi:hypothetical protein